MALVTASYTIFGGMKAVIATDVIQSVLVLIAGIAVCGICHDSENRADLVPALSLPGERDSDYWRPWIENGKPNTLMPGFSQEKEGPLSKDQIDSLVEFLSANSN